MENQQFLKRKYSRISFKVTICPFRNEKDSYSKFAFIKFLFLLLLKNSSSNLPLPE